MVELALWPYINLETYLVADLDNLEKEPVIYNLLTHEVYENNNWIYREIDLRWKFLVRFPLELPENSEILRPEVTG